MFEVVLFQEVKERLVASDAFQEELELILGPVFAQDALDVADVLAKLDSVLVGANAADKDSIVEGAVVTHILFAIDAVLVEGVGLDHLDQHFLDLLGAFARALQVRILEVWLDHWRVLLGETRVPIVYWVYNWLILDFRFYKGGVREGMGEGTFLVFHLKDRWLF